MRFFTTLFIAVLLSGMALAQMPDGRGYQYISAPFVPLVTTPEVSLNSVSPASVGATNATHGLTAGARNSTLTMMNGDTSSEYTEPFWYSGGGAPMTGPAVSLEARPTHARPMGMEMGMHMMEEHRRERPEAEQREWAYFASVEESASPVDAASSAKSGKHATRTITNQDVDQENQKNGQVKYDGKTETIQ